MPGKLQSNWPEWLGATSLTALILGFVAWVLGLIPFSVTVAVLGLFTLASAVFVGQRRTGQVGVRKLVFGLGFIGGFFLVIAYSLLAQGH